MCDQITAVIKVNGETPHYRIIEDYAEYLQSLLQKDAEEGKELADKRVVFYVSPSYAATLLKRLNTQKPLLFLVQFFTARTLLSV